MEKQLEVSTAGGREGKEKRIQYEVITGCLDMVGFPLFYLNTACKQFASLNVLFDLRVCYELIRIEKKEKENTFSRDFLFDYVVIFFH